MRSRIAGHGLRAVRAVLVLAGVGIAALSTYTLATVPPEPPGGTGFVRGGVLLVWGALLVVSLGVAGFGVALPALLGATDSLGFGRYQRWTLRLAGLSLVAGAALGVGGLLANSFVGMIVSAPIVLLGVFGVCVVLAWRLGEVVRERFGGADAAD